MSRNVSVKELQQKTTAETQGPFVTMPNTKPLYPSLTQKRLQQVPTPSPKPHSTFMPTKSEFEQEHVSGDKLVDKLHIQPDDASHYYSCLPIKPACGFLPSLLQYREKLKQLHLNIPITVFTEDQKNYIAKTNIRGEVEILEDVTIEEDYYREVTQYVNFSNVDKDTTPAVFSLSSYTSTLSSDPCSIKMEAWSFTALEKKSMRHLQPCNILQQYLQGKSQCNSFVRLVYYPKRQLSEGHMVDNILAAFDEVKSIDRGLQTYFRPFPSEDTKYYLRRGGSLIDYENEAKKIYTFLLYDVGLRVEKLVVDMMRGADNRLWFLNLKSYELEASLYRLKEVHVAMGKQEVTEEKRARKDEAENTVICKMCGLRYKVPELSKSLTMKMVYNVKDHLEKRGISVYKHLKGEAPENMAHTMKACSLCYSLAIAEYDLIDTECKLAQIQGIPATVETILCKSWNKYGENANPIMDRSLYQWRVMIHLEYLFDIPPAFLKETADYRIQYKIFDYTISFPLCFNKRSLKTHHSIVLSHNYRSNSLSLASNRRLSRGTADDPTYYDKERLDINKLRTSYFFSPTCDLDEFLKSEGLSIRITEGEDWEKFIASGNSNIFTDCTSCDYVNTCIKYTKAILLFRRGNLDQIMKLKVNAGIIRGEDVATSMIQMSPYGSYSIYFPPESYVTSEQFPCEWMELFDKDGGARNRPELFYSMSMDEKDFKFYHPKRKNSPPKTAPRPASHLNPRTPARLVSKFASSAGAQMEKTAVETVTESSKEQPKDVKVKIVERISDLSDTKPQAQTVAETKRPQTASVSQFKRFESITEKLKLESRATLEEIRKQIAEMSKTEGNMKPRGKRGKNKLYGDDLKVPATTTHSRRKLIKMFQSARSSESFKNPYGTVLQSPSIWHASTVPLKRKKVKRVKLASKSMKKSLQSDLFNLIAVRTSDDRLSKRPIDLYNTVKI